MAIDTGHGATISFGTQGGTWRATRITPSAESRPAIDASHLGTTGYREFLPGDLINAGEFVVEFQFQGNQGLPTRTTAETVTITHALASGEATAATIAGTAFVTEAKYPDLNTDELKKGSFTVKWDGYTGPTYTAAT